MNISTVGATEIGQCRNESREVQWIRGTKVFQKSRSFHRIVGARRMTWSEFHTEDPQILGTIIQNLVPRAAGHPGFVHPCAELLFNCRIGNYANQPVIYLEVTCCFGINVGDNVFCILKTPAVKYNNFKNIISKVMKWQIIKLKIFFWSPDSDFVKVVSLPETLWLWSLLWDRIGFQICICSGK